jgi:superfamily I DNA/RNA helicase
MNRLSETLPPKVAGRVTITTMHGAKGLSADVVMVLQAEDEMIPGDAAGAEFDESRRLLYVSLTRARKKLLIGACQQRFGSQRFVGTREVKARTLTRFLRDFGLQAKTAAMYVDGMGR